MHSPFPGMDPYLEGYLWPDVHHRLAGVIAELLGPLLAPKYVARIELYTVEDTSPEEDIGILYPDVEVLLRKDDKREIIAQRSPSPLSFTPITVSVPALPQVEIRIPFVEIRDQKKNQLITAIEVLSPVNKRRPGLEPYRKKKKNLQQAGVHLLEIDFLRRGTRSLQHTAIPPLDYMVALSRAGQSKIDIWGIDIKDKLPVVAVPLKHPDKDVPLDLAEAIRLIYQRGHYYLSIDYTTSPPPPSFSKEGSLWLKQILKAYFTDENQ
ncbi:MAG TPA: DUF4058 family protein [Saprospiraceae bacterium]|nr:DUF4058 family protein [Saprospiraceae bacterium]